MKIKFLEQTETELLEAIDYYETRKPGLGLELYNEIDQNIQWIIENFDIPKIRKGGYRRVNVDVFPYFIVYVVINDTIWFLAIAHNHRKPEYWTSRTALLQ